MTVLVVDTEVSNLRSVVTALRALSYRVQIIRSGAQLRHTSSRTLIFPGVGDAQSTMDSLTRRGLDGMLRRFIRDGGVVLGICVGAQLLLHRSEERDAVGLRVVRGTNRRLPDRTADGTRLKIPQIGWNTVRARSASALFLGIPQDSAFYFAHSYCMAPSVRTEQIAWCEYGGLLSVAFAAGRVYGVQFHPEKSGPHGLRLLRNFVSHSARLQCS